MIKNDHAILGVHGTLESAQQEAKLIQASQVRIVTLYPPVTSGNFAPIGWIVVPNEHKCPACSQHVPGFDGVPPVDRGEIAHHSV